MGKFLIMAFQPPLIVEDLRAISSAILFEDLFTILYGMSRPALRNAKRRRLSSVNIFPPCRKTLIGGNWEALTAPVRSAFDRFPIVPPELKFQLRDSL
jgi:hypothetical protein